MFCYKFTSDPINPHQPIHVSVSTRLLTTNQMEAIDSRSEEERLTEEGSRNLQTIQSCLTTLGIRLYLLMSR